jgi:hypothetical protein
MVKGESRPALELPVKEELLGQLSHEVGAILGGISPDPPFGSFSPAGTFTGA